VVDGHARADGPRRWFKACMPVLAHEPALLKVLAARRPDAVPELVAVDKRRSWMLQRDAGTRLRELVQGKALVEVWRELLPFNAELQIDAAPDCDQLLAAGAPDRRLALVPGQYEGLVADEAIAPALGAEEARRAQELAPKIADLCAELAALGVRRRSRTTTSTTGTSSSATAASSSSTGATHASRTRSSRSP